MRNVTIRQLQMLVASAEAGSFTRAGEKLFVSPAAVSFQIKQLEDQFGFSLFERIGRRVDPTDAGHALLGFARTVLQALTDADDTLRSLEGEVAGRIRLGAVSTAKYIVPHMLARFSAMYPRVGIDLRFGNRRAIAQALHGGDIDLAVMGQPGEAADVTAHGFAIHPSILLADPGHPLAGAGYVSIAELAPYGLIAREEGSGTRLLMERIFLDAGIPPRIVMTTDSNETIKQAVMAGMGLAILSRHTVGLELALGLVRMVPAAGFPLLRTWYVAHRTAMPLMPAHIRLRDFLLSDGQAVIDRLEAGYERAWQRA